MLHHPLVFDGDTTLDPFHVNNVLYVSFLIILYNLTKTITFQNFDGILVFCYDFLVIGFSGLHIRG